MRKLSQDTREQTVNRNTDVNLVKEYDMCCICINMYVSKQKHVHRHKSKVQGGKVTTSRCIILISLYYLDGFSL